VKWVCKHGSNEELMHGDIALQQKRGYVAEFGPKSEW
jgi:hypothetical protein